MRSGPSLRTFGADGKCINHWRCKHIVIDFFFFQTELKEGQEAGRIQRKELGVPDGGVSTGVFGEAGSLFKILARELNICPSGEPYALIEISRSSFLTPFLLRNRICLSLFLLQIWSHNLPPFTPQTFLLLKYGFLDKILQVTYTESSNFGFLQPRIFFHSQLDLKIFAPCIQASFQTCSFSQVMLCHLANTPLLELAGFL